MKTSLGRAVPLSNTVGVRAVAFVVSLAATVVLGTGENASAQGVPRVEVSAGYAALPGLDVDLPMGLYASAAWRVTPWLKVVGDVGWHKRIQRFEDHGFMAESEVFTVLGGPRFVPWSSNRITPFAEFLVGMHQFRNHVKDLHPNPFFPAFDVELELSGVALQPGGGMVLWFNRHIGAQIALHYRHTLDRSLGELRLSRLHEARLSTGLTVTF